MEVLQALDDLSDIETGSGLLKPRVVLIHQVDVVPLSNRESGLQLKCDHYTYCNAVDVIVLLF